jgi:hypothetical protein
MTIEERKLREFWVRPQHEKLPFGACVDFELLGGVHVIEKAAYDKQSEALRIAVEALKFIALGENQFTDGVEQMHKAREALTKIEEVSGE